MAREAHPDSHEDVGSDGHLISLVRGGDISAFDALYERHVPIASKVARRNVDNPSDAEDVVAEAFQSVLQSLMAGKGPESFFRAYLLSTVTRLSHQRNRKAGRVLPSSDDTVLDQVLTTHDPAIDAFESETVAKAFRALPERWQAVLWYVDVERMKPAMVAPILGMSPNAVSALALRAREGLRRQYLQSHLADHKDDGCAEYVSKLGNYVRGGLARIADRKVADHVLGCKSCTAALAELRDVQGSMRAVLLPLMTGIPVAAWAGKGAGIGALGGVLQSKGLGLPGLAQPAVIAMMTAAGVGVILGAVGIINQSAASSYSESQALDAGSTRPVEYPASPTTAPPTTAAPSTTSSNTAAPSTTAPTPTTSAASAPDNHSSTPVAERPLPPVVPSELVSPVVPSESVSPTVPSAPVTPDPLETPAPDTTPAPASPAAPKPTPPAPTSTPRPTLQPQPSSVPKPTPTPVPLAKTRVTGSAQWNRDRSDGDKALDIDFDAYGSESLGAGKAVFSVGPFGFIKEGSVRAPEGWSCSLAKRQVLVCSTENARRSDLHFHVSVESKSHKDHGLLTYSLVGERIVPNLFAYGY